MDEKQYWFAKHGKRGQWLLLTVASLLMLFAPLYFATYNYKTQVLRPLILDLQFIAVAIYCMAIPLIFLVMLAIQRSLRQRSKDEVNQSVLGQLLIGVYGFVAIFLVWLTFSADRFSYITYTELNSHRYELHTRLTRADDGSGSDLTLILYRCDSWGLYCQYLHESSEVRQLNIYPEPQTTQLVADRESGVLSIVIDDETIYTYMPE